MSNKFEKTFTVNLIGDVTGDKWMGSFTVKTRLSHRDRLRIDQLRRQFLGGMADGPSPTQEAMSTAVVLSELRVRLTDAPQWWDAMDYGAELYDLNLVADVYKQAIAAEAEQDAILRQKADDARKVLRREVERLPPEDIQPAGGLPSSSSLLPE